MRMIVKVIKEPPRGDAGEVLTAGEADEALYHHTQELKSHRGVCAHRLRELEKRTNGPKNGCDASKNESTFTDTVFMNRKRLSNAQACP